MFLLNVFKKYLPFELDQDSQHKPKSKIKNMSSSSISMDTSTDYMNNINVTNIDIKMADADDDADDDTDEKMGLQLSDDSQVEEVTITFFGKNNVTLNKEEIGYWKVQSSKIAQDLENAGDEEKVTFEYSPLFKRNFFDEEKCSFEEVWSIINKYVNYHKTNIGVIYEGNMRSKVLASCTEDNEDANLIEETIGRNLYLLYSAMSISDYLGMKPFGLLLSKKLESHTLYEPEETHEEILNVDTPVVYIWDDWCGNRDEKKETKGL
jgi:hypothetical protein